MRPFTYQRVSSADDAIHAIGTQPNAVFVAGGTELLNWLKEGILGPDHLVDINALPLTHVIADADGLRIGALARMSEVAAHEDVRREYPAMAESLELSASPQLRNMASMGGNLLQRTRCAYFRADAEVPCNKRRANTGCSARHGENRLHALFGWSDACVATHPSDVAVVLAALDASVDTCGPDGPRSIPILDLHRLPDDEPTRDTVLAAGELITQIRVPRSPVCASSRYVKIRERASYEFAVVSAAAAVELDGEIIRAVRLALGGVAHKPWRLRRSERALVGSRLDRAAILAAVDEDFMDARPLEQNAFKITLARRAAARALEAAGGQP